MRDLERCTLGGTACSTRAPCLTSQNGYYNVLGVKGAQVQILSARRSRLARWFWMFVQVSGPFCCPFMILLDCPSRGSPDIAL